ncbi:MAG: hypothetical protein ACYC7D_01435 [Nitrososphaerales archaeon]
MNRRDPRFVLGLLVLVFFLLLALSLATTQVYSGIGSCGESGSTCFILHTAQQSSFGIVQMHYVQVYQTGNGTYVVYCAQPSSSSCQATSMALLFSDGSAIIVEQGSCHAPVYRS